MAKDFKLKFDQWTDVLVFISQPHGTNGLTLARISKELDITYSHLSDVVNALIKYKFVKKTKKGRCCYCETTKAGDEVANMLIKILIKLNK